MTKTVRIAALIGALVFVAAMAFDHDPEFDMKIAWNAYRAGDMDSALRMARMAALLSCQDSKEWSASHELQARAAMKLKRPARANAILDRLLQANPEHVGGLQLRGELKLRAGDAAGALADLTRSQKGAENSPAKPHKSQAPHLARRGQAFLQAGNLAAALKDAQTAYALNPKHPQVLYTLSLVLEKQGRFPAALEHMEKAAHAANRMDRSFIMSSQGNQWIERLITLRVKAKAPSSRPYVPKD